MEKEQKLSPEEVCKLIEIATNWRNPRGGCVYEGKFGNSSPPYENSYLEMKVENRGQCLGSAQLSSTQGTLNYSPEIEEYMELYRRIQKKDIEKNIREIREARQKGFAEAKRILESILIKY